MTLTTTTPQPRGPEDEAALDAPKREEVGRARDGSRQKWYSSAIARILMIGLSLLFLLPLYWMIASALKSGQELSHYPPTWFPQEFHWENFVNAVNAMPFWSFFRNTAVITVLSVIFSVVSNFIVAYGFACLEWKGRDRVFYIVLATLFIPFPVTLIPMFDLYANLGWVNTWLPLIVPNLFASAFFVFLLRQFLLQIPKDMLDAARLDAASEWAIAWRLVFPTALPALTAVGIFSAVGAWNDFMGPLIYLQDVNVQTLSIGLQAFRQTNQQDIQFNELMAASVLVIAPLIILFFVFQRYFLKGITLGGFK
ncbi:carbohydrate ABC transporter permease [Lacisediminihabitans profunda]|uniref:carbohydrate ABC transporter permease n=1 Tax=Lacisediminihabitans profunda TaxID=2594790 RepID=UPI001FE9C61C|nr:carbohydrate ABC transporter permease [Lacisediminihabitans profunda]